MGMFDTVNVICPKCLSHVEVQSKAGPCELKTYEQYSVPVAIAQSIDGDVVTCRSCGYDICLRVVGHIPARVAIGTQ